MMSVMVLCHLNVEKIFVVERFLPPPPPPSLSRGFIAARLICKLEYHETMLIRGQSFSDHGHDESNHVNFNFDHQFSMGKGLFFS